MAFLRQRGRKNGRLARKPCRVDTQNAQNGDFVSIRGSLKNFAINRFFTIFRELLANIIQHNELTMKQNLFLTLLALPVLLTVVSCNKASNQHKGPLTLEEAIELTKNEWDKYESAIAWDAPIPANTKMDIVLGVMGKEYEVSPAYETWLIVADTNPLANGGPHYKWIFVSTETGQISTLMTTSEPFTTDEEKDFIHHIIVVKEGRTIEPHIAHINSCNPTKRIRADALTNQSANNCWALILSGGINVTHNYSRYWNDCSYIYKTLTQQYAFPKSNIIALISDGDNPAEDMILKNGLCISSPVDLDEDNLPDVQYSATKNNLASAFSYLANNVQPGDNVLIYVIDHGGHDGSSSYICLWNNQILYPFELASMVGQITPEARIHFVLGQCNSGGFISALSGNNRTIATACGEYEESYATLDGENDEFVYQWTKSIDEDIIFSDKNQDGKCSLHEAFNYANKEDYYSRNNIEHPQYDSTPSLFGDHYDIRGQYSPIPRIIGNSDLSSSFSQYSIEDLPEGATVNWHISINNQAIPAGTGRSIYLSNSFSSMPYQPATISITSTNVGLYTDTKFITLWKSGIHMNNSLIIDNGNDRYGEFALWTNPIGATNFVWGINDSDTQIYSNGFFAIYEVNGDHELDYTEVWVSFNNPLGEQTTVVRTTY